VLAAAATLTLLALASTAAADTGKAVPLIGPGPSWYTPQLHAQVMRAGAKGVQVREELLNTECPGFQGLRGLKLGEGVSAGGCIVAVNDDPVGCTANFIFTSGSTKYVGTARHCIDEVGDTVTMQVDSITLVAVGTVVKKTSGEGEPEKDFALIRLFSDVVQRWGVNPALPVGGPNGVYAGCDPQPVKYWGHGYGAAVAQGKPEGGLATNWRGTAYAWAGFGAPGDSGSGVVLAADNKAAGNFTHLLLTDMVKYPGSNLAGMRATAILQFVGSKIKLMNANRSSSGSPGGACSSPKVLGGGRGPRLGADAVNAAGEVVDDAGEAVDEAREEVENAGDKVEDAVEKVGGTVRDAL
jgi:hypothetical protein